MQRIPLSGRAGAGLFALVDDADAELVSGYRWRLFATHRTNYAQATVGHRPDRSVILMHRLITGYPRTDHENGDGLDNQRANLRRATPAQNGANRQATQGSGSSRYKGVTWDKKRGRWRAHLRHRGRLQFLGHFADEADAARAYDAAARETFGEYARPNLPMVTPRQQS